MNKITQNQMDSAPTTDMGDSYRLFLDLSSTCTGYVIAKFSERKCEIARAGVMWFGDKWENGQKYFHLQDVITSDFYVVNAITDVIYESYHVNPKQVGNSLVVPEMIGAMKACCYDIASMPLGTEDLSPTAWRGQLGIKPLKTPKMKKDGTPELTKAGKQRYDNDYKTPTISYMDKMFDNQIPKKLRSNITGNFRATPNDLYDALGVCLGWHKKLGVSEFVLKDGCFDGTEGGTF